METFRSIQQALRFMDRFPRRHWRWFLPLLWMSAIHLLSTDAFSFPELRRSSAGFLAAKGVHLFEYAVLSFLWYQAIANGLSRWDCRAAISSFVAASSYAIVDEFHQSLTLQRSGNIIDILLDWCGAFFATVTLWMAHHRGLWTPVRRGRFNG